jgi:hypothetical protein
MRPDSQVPIAVRGTSGGSPLSCIDSPRRSSAAAFIANDTPTAVAMTRTSTANALLEADSRLGRAIVNGRSGC